MTPSTPDRERKTRILEAIRLRGFANAAADDDIRKDMLAEANSSSKNQIITHDLLAVAEATNHVRATGPTLSLFRSTDDVIIVPGFMGSELDDVTGDNGLVWIDPLLVLDSDQLSTLQLKKEIDQDETEGVTIQANGAIPAIYGGLKYALEFSRYHVDIFGFDWRKHVDASAGPLAELIRARADQPPRPLHIIAHSQGSLVARRAIQLVGPELARRLISSVVLLGPATGGTFSAAFAIAGNHSLIETVRRYGIKPPAGFKQVLQSMSGLYQLIPWRTNPVNGRDSDEAIQWARDHFKEQGAGSGWFRGKDAWKTGVEEARLQGLAGWAKQIDAGFVNDRTTIILGDAETVSSVKFEKKANSWTLVASSSTKEGDGTVPDSLALIEGVSRVYKATGAEHMMLPATWSVITAVRKILAGKSPQIEPFRLTSSARDEAEPSKTPPSPRLEAGPSLPTPNEVFGVKHSRPSRAGAASALQPPPRGGNNATATPPKRTVTSAMTRSIAEVTPPAVRRLKVFSFDPLFATELGNLGAEQITIELLWSFADGERLQPGPVGEYLEVVDYDSSSGCFYPPVDLNHPHILAQDGVPISEGNPRFHQQMVYAVAMNTIHHFEAALGRAVLWAPNLQRDEFGSVIPSKRPDEEYVQRLRVYPHAMREQNAYYSPQKKALLFGYFSADGNNVGRNLPGGLIFSCLSYDIVAHETTHALLDGLHRYFIEPSNEDVFAFHEAFADIVSLLQHFTHPSVLRHQLKKARGRLDGDHALGLLAAQFGEATGRGGGLRSYLGRRNEKTGTWESVLPDANALNASHKPHDRGAILVAAVFRAFLNIYEFRASDLRRVGGCTIQDDCELPVEMVDRLTEEAAKSAKHLLRMCIRALDYVPPVDITFGEYLRALITADYDLVRDDDRRYRVAIISAFREWGIFPPGVRSLSVDSLLWSPPEWKVQENPAIKRDVGSGDVLGNLRDFFRTNRIDEWNQSADRLAAYRQMNNFNAALHEWLVEPKNLPYALAKNSLGLALDAAVAPGGIRRDSKGRPVFQVHMCRPCRRIGPDGQERTEMVVEVVQRRLAFYDEADQLALDKKTGDAWSEEFYEDQRRRADFVFRGGCTLIIDPKAGVIRYCIRKDITAEERLRKERKVRQGLFRSTSAAFLDPSDDSNPFALLHSHE